MLAFIPQVAVNSRCLAGIDNTVQYRYVIPHTWIIEPLFPLKKSTAGELAWRFVCGTFWTWTVVLILTSLHFAHTVPPSSSWGQCFARDTDSSTFQISEFEVEEHTSLLFACSLVCGEGVCLFVC
jgi:hypothetical protein